MHEVLICSHLIFYRARSLVWIRLIPTVCRKAARVRNAHAKYVQYAYSHFLKNRSLWRIVTALVKSKPALKMLQRVSIVRNGTRTRRPETSGNDVS